MINGLFALIQLLTPISLLIFCCYTFRATLKDVKDLESGIDTNSDNPKYKEFTEKYEEHTGREITASKMLCIVIFGYILVAMFVVWGNIIFLNKYLAKVALVFTKVIGSDRLPVDEDSIFAIISLRAITFQYLQLYAIIILGGTPILIFLVLYFTLYFNQTGLMELLMPSLIFQLNYYFLALYILIFWLTTILLSFIIFYILYLNSEDPKIFLSENCYKLAHENFDPIIICKEQKLNFGNGLLFSKNFLLIVGDLQILSEDEIFSCILHEIGHGGPVYILWFLFTKCFVSILSCGVVFYLVDNFVNMFFHSTFGALKTTFFVINLPVIYIFNNLVCNFFNFRSEYKADHYVKSVGCVDEMMNALIKLHHLNFAPNKMNVWTNLLVSSHPCNYARIKNLFVDN